MKQQLIKFDDEREVLVTSDAFEVKESDTNPYHSCITNKQLREVLEHFPDEALMYIGTDEGYFALKHGELGAGSEDGYLGAGEFKDRYFDIPGNVKILSFFPVNLKPQFYDSEEK